jgi:hypothetical protein
VLSSVRDVVAVSVSESRLIPAAIANVAGV